jgi:hypothetical protein
MIMLLADLGSRWQLQRFVAGLAFRFTTAKLRKWLEGFRGNDDGGSVVEVKGRR